MITIKNRVKKIKVSTVKIKSVIQKMLKEVGYDDFDIGLLLTTDATIRRYNKTYRKKDKATDILSFPYHTDLKPGQDVAVFEPEDKNLGDMIISLEFAKKDARAKKRSLSEHLSILLAHGVAHLLGYDHKTDKEYKKMQRFEERLLNSL